MKPVSWEELSIDQLPQKMTDEGVAVKKNNGGGVVERIGGGW